MQYITLNIKAEKSETIFIKLSRFYYVLIVLEIIK
jgi:hypothetical protein